MAGLSQLHFRVILLWSLLWSRVKLTQLVTFPRKPQGKKGDTLVHGIENQSPCVIITYLNIVIAAVTMKLWHLPLQDEDVPVQQGVVEEVVDEEEAMDEELGMGEYQELPGRVALVMMAGHNGVH